MLTYNHGPYIARAIDGVLSQRCDFPIELVIGEDRSTDSTADVVHSYRIRFPELIRVITSNRNVGSRANSARCRASLRGRFVAICEGDDFWTDPCKLQTQVRLLNDRPGISCVVHAARVQDAHGNVMNTFVRPAFSSRLLTMRELVRGSGYMVPTASVVCRREVVDDPPDWQRDATVGDYPLMLRARILGEVAYLNTAMSVFRTGVPGSWTERRGNSLDANFQHSRAMDRLLSGFDGYTGYCHSKAVSAAISKYYSDALVYSDGSDHSRWEVFMSVRDRLHTWDRLFSWLAARHGVRLVRIKTALRKLATLRRILRGELASRHAGVAPRPNLEFRP